MTRRPLFIAEVKTMSPFGFRSDSSWEELFAIASREGDWISIHTDPRWGGSFDLVRKARSLTTKPILAKGIHESDRDLSMAFEAGADYVLVVGRIPEVFRDKVLVEPLDLASLDRVPKDMKAVWNSRDLSTGGKKTEGFREARARFDGWLCQASGICGLDDISVDADAVLVGESLKSFIKSKRL